jgi:hypothetical protein
MTPRLRTGALTTPEPGVLRAGVATMTAARTPMIAIRVFMSSPVCCFPGDVR